MVNMVSKYKIQHMDGFIVMFVFIVPFNVYIYLLSKLIPTLTTYVQRLICQLKNLKIQHLNNLQTVNLN